MMPHPPGGQKPACLGRILALARRAYLRHQSPIDVGRGLAKGTVVIVSGHQYSTAERIESLDLLRGLAAFAVMIPHFFMYYLQDASVLAEVVSITAVEVFFILSGFVLGPQIVLCARRRNWATLRTFLVRRWMRTIPSYLAALLAISLIFREIGSADFFRYATYLQNLFSQHNTRDYYPVAWSLSVEEWYYVVFPAFLLLYGKTTKAGAGQWRDYVCATLLFIAVITVIRSAYGDTADWGAQVRRVVVFRIDSIAYGFLLYLALLQVKLEWNVQTRCAAFLLLAVTTALVLYVNGRMLESDAAWLRQVNPFISAGFGMATLVFFLSLNPLLRARWMRAAGTYLGQISYPIYLFHLVVLYGLARVLTQHDDPWQFLLYLAAVVLLTTVFFYGFERPILASRPRYRGAASHAVHAARTGRAGTTMK
jgi:peptidoglycan/LPS O-acetylase OafA/YrhL